MVLSKGRFALNIVKFVHKNANKPLQIVRNSHHWNYRAPGPEPSKNIYLAAELVQGVAWWWVLWHLFTEPGHVFGEFDYPDPRAWSDEELGIPAID